MNVDQVNERVARLRDVAHDPALVHEGRDDLYVDAFVAIACNDAHPSPYLLAAAVLRAEGIVSPGWCI